jgi:hypothetical protein
MEKYSAVELTFHGLLFHPLAIVLETFDVVVFGVTGVEGVDIELEAG